MNGVNIIVCTSCRNADDADSRPGALLLDAVRGRMEARGVSLPLEPVECLAVCKRPATLTLAAQGKWTYVIGDLDVDRHVDDVIDAALAYAASENGIVPWKERPVCFRKGVVSRTPPLG